MDIKKYFGENSLTELLNKLKELLQFSVAYDPSEDHEFDDIKPRNAETLGGIDASEYVTKADDPVYSAEEEITEQDVPVDADTLDGMGAEYYAKAAEMLWKPFYEKGLNTDLNTHFYGVVRIVTSLSAIASLHAPYQYGVCIAYGNDSRYASQIFMTNENVIFTRLCKEGSWSEWKQLALNADLTTKEPKVAKGVFTIKVSAGRNDIYHDTPLISGSLPASFYNSVYTVASLASTNDATVSIHCDSNNKIIITASVGQNITIKWFEFA